MTDPAITLSTVRNITFGDIATSTHTPVAFIPNQLRLKLEAIPQEIPGEIKSELDLHEMGNFLTRRVAPLMKEVRAYFKPLKAEKLSQHRAMVAQEKLTLERLAQINDAAREAILTYQKKRKDEYDAFHEGAESFEDLLNAGTLMMPDGIGGKSKWRGVVDDKKVLVEFVLENWDAFNDLIDINQKALDKRAREQQRGFNIPGAHADESAGLVVHDRATEED